MRLETFNQGAQRAIHAAHQHALSLNHKHIGPEHLLHVFIKNEELGAKKLLRFKRESEKNILSQLDALLQQIPLATSQQDDTPISRGLESVLLQAQRFAKEESKEQVSIPFMVKAVRLDNSVQSCLQDAPRRSKTAPRRLQEAN